MRMNPFRLPISGEKHVGNAKQPCYAGAESNQRVHIGCLMPELLPRSFEKSRSTPEDYRCAEQKHYQIGIRNIHEEHPDKKHRQGENYGSCCHSLQLLVICLLLFLKTLSIAVDNQVIPSVDHQTAHNLRRYRIGVIFDTDV